MEKHSFILNPTLPGLNLLMRDALVPRAALYLVAPAVSFLSKKDGPQTIWWGTPAIIVGLVAICQHWMHVTEEGMRNLERLRYEAQGA